jgi:hypothetical protein
MFDTLFSFNFIGMDAFVFVGHGSDSGEFKNRKPMPKGYTLVTLAQCGTITRGDLQTKFDALAVLGKEVLEDPVKHKEAIEKALGGLSIHVYPPGTTHVPDLTFRFPAVQFTDDKSHVAYNPSGIFRLPYHYTQEFMKQENVERAQNLYNQIYENDDNLLKRYFRIYKKQHMEEGYKALEEKGATLETFLHSVILRISLYRIFGMIPEKPALVPPGVYYHVVCRAYGKLDEGLIVNEKILSARERSASQQARLFGKTRKSAPKRTQYVFVKHPHIGIKDEEDRFDNFEDMYQAYETYIQSEEKGIFPITKTKNNIRQELEEKHHYKIKATNYEKPKFTELHLVKKVYHPSPKSKSPAKRNFGVLKTNHKSKTLKKKSARR